MLKLKTKWFNKWAKKNSISNDALSKTLDALAKNLSVVNLGSGLYKIRTAKAGLGKSGGYRTLVVYKKLDKAIFVYGFSKTDRENLNSKELAYFKKLAKDLLLITDDEYARQVRLGHFFTLENER